MDLVKLRRVVEGSLRSGGVVAWFACQFFFSSFFFFLEVLIYSIQEGICLFGWTLLYVPVGLLLFKRSAGFLLQGRWLLNVLLHHISGTLTPIAKPPQWTNKPAFFTYHLEAHRSQRCGPYVRHKAPLASPPGQRPL